MRAKGWLALALALAVAFAAAAPASADVIDFDPATDEVPSILPPADMEKYAALLGVSSSAVVSSASPDGRYVLVRSRGAYEVLDTTTKTLAPVDLGAIGGATPWAWRSNSVATALAVRYTDERLLTVNVDCSTRTVATADFALPEVPGKIVSVFGGPLLRMADGSFHVAGYTETASQPMARFVRPTLAPGAVDDAVWFRSMDEQSWLLQSEESMLAIDIDTGEVVTIGKLAPGHDLYTSLASVRSRPGTSVVSYVVAESLPWAGQDVGGRPYRGGGMPTSYWNTREALGKIAPGDNRWITTRAIEIANLDSGQRRTVQNAPLATFTEPAPKFTSAAWTDDGSRLVVTAARPSLLDGRAHPVYEYTSGTRFLAFQPSGELIGDLTWDVPYVDGPGSRLSPISGTRMALVVPDNVWRDLYVVDVASTTTPATPVYRGPRYLGGFAFAGQRLVYAMQDASDPVELYISDVADFGRSQVRLTDANAAVRRASGIAFAPITYTTSRGATVTGTYVYPADWAFPPPSPRPVVVWQEGGPGGQMVNAWGASVESPYSLLPNFGVPVFVVNGSGRISNGAQFYSDMAEGTNYGQRDIADVREGVLHLISRGIVDPKAVGVTGCSYGGYFTLQSMASYPDTYAAGNSQCSFNDLLYEWSFGWSPLVAYLMGESATGNPAEFTRDSPYYNVHRITSPLLLFHGTDDFLPY